MDIFRFVQAAAITGPVERSIRITAENPPRASLLDVIAVVSETATNNHSKYLTALIKNHPDIVDYVGYYKFPGQGQRPTAVTDAKGLVHILLLLPGRNAARFRCFAADTIVRVLGGDMSIAEELRANREAAETDPEGAQAFFSQHHSSFFPRNRVLTNGQNIAF